MEKILFLISMSVKCISCRMKDLKKCDLLTDKQTYLQTNRFTYRQTDLLTDKQTYLQTNRLTYRQTDLFNYRHSDKVTHREALLLKISKLKKICDAHTKHSY